MTEHEFLGIRQSVFANIFKSNDRMKQLQQQITGLKKQQEKKLADYDKMDQVKEVDAKRALVQEEYNLSIKAKQNLIKKEEAYIDRAQTYFNYIVAYRSNNEKDMKTYKEKFLNTIQKQAIEECDNSISLIKQKRITANKLSKYIELNPALEQEKEKLVSNEELDKDRMRQFDLEDEKKMMENAFKKETPLLTDALMKNQKMCEQSPFTSIKEIYPNVREQVAVREESRGKAA